MSSSPDSESQPPGAGSYWPNFLRMSSSKARSSNKPQDGFRTGTGIPSAHENRETALNQQIFALKDQVRQLQDQVQALQQGQDFRSHFKDSGIPHDKIQQQLSTMEVEIQGWARMALKGSDWKSPDGKFPAAVHLQQGEFPNFKNALWQICHDDMKPDFLQQISSTDLLAAIASCIIVEQAVMNPLGPCTRKFEGDVNSDVYKVMSNSEASLANRQSAKSWQAACLKRYETTITDTDEFGSAEEKATAHNLHVDSVLSTISVALEEIFGHYRVNFSHTSRQRSKLRNAITEATKIGKTLGGLQSGLVLMDKPWFCKQADERGRVSPSDMGDRMRLLYEPDGGKVIKGKVAVVLFPGLLKYGSDNGEGWESWSVWKPAIVELMDMEIEAPPPPPPPPPPPVLPVPDPRHNTDGYDGYEDYEMYGANYAAYNKQAKTTRYQPAAYNTPGMRYTPQNLQPARPSAHEPHATPQTDYNLRYPQPAQPAQPIAYNTPEARRSGTQDPHRQPPSSSTQSSHTTPQSYNRSRSSQPAQPVAYNTPETRWSGSQGPYRQAPSSSAHNPQSNHSSSNSQPAHPVADNTPEARSDPHNLEAPQSTWPDSESVQASGHPSATSESQPDGKRQANPGGFVGYQQQWSPAQVALGEPLSGASHRQIDHEAPEEPQEWEYAR